MAELSTPPVEPVWWRAAWNKVNGVFAYEKDFLCRTWFEARKMAFVYAGTDEVEVRLREPAAETK